MKKILFTLLLFTGYLHAQTYPVNPTKFGKISLNTNGISTSTTKINTQESDGQINYIDAVNLPVPTTVTNALDLKTTVSAGAVSGFALTNNGNGTVNIASGIAYLRLTNDPYSSIVKYPISAVTNLALTDNANNFVLVDYNAGNPTITVTTNSSTINTQTNSLAYVISRVGNTLDYLNLVGQNVDPNAKLRVRFLNQEGIRRASGAILGFSNRNLTLTSSVLFSGLIRLDAPAFNTLTPDTFTLAYNNGATWTRTTGQTQVNNTQYNVSGTLTDLGNNDYRTDYVYLLPNNPSKLYVIMGTASYTSLTLAQAAPIPSSLPTELQVLGIEAGRLFIQKNNASINSVQSSFSNDFVGASVPEHNSLSGLQGGLADQRNHLDNSQVSLVNGSEQVSNKATDFTTANNNLYPSVQAVKTYADGLVVGLLNDRGSWDASTNLFPTTGGSGISGAIRKGDMWFVSVAGILGGKAVTNGDSFRALVNNPAQTASNWSVLEANIGYVPENQGNKSSSYTASSTVTYADTKALVDGLGTKVDKSGDTMTGALYTDGLSYKKGVFYSGDLNNLTDAGFYVANDPPNSPMSSAIYITVERDLTNSGAHQVATSFVTNQIFSRIRYSNVWTPWRELSYADSPIFTGTPTAPTATAGTNTTQIATTAYVDSANTGNLKTTGNQSFTGTKSSTITSGTSGAINIINDVNSTGATGIRVSNTSTSSTNGTTAIYASNSNAGANTAAVYSENTSTGQGILSKNLSTGVGNSFSNWSSGDMTVYDTQSGATGNHIVFKKVGSQVAKIDVDGNATFQKYNLNTGSNASSGNATLVAGTVTVTTSAATANSLIQLTRKTASGTLGFESYTTTNGSFTITSLNPLDTSEFTYLIIN